MILQRCAGFFRLRGERAGAEIAGQAIFQDHATCSQGIGERGIAHHRDAVPDALRSQNFDGFAHRFGAADFSRMADEMEALMARVVECGAEIHRGTGELVAAHAKGHHSGGLQFRSPARHLIRGLRAELARGVENPGGLQAAEGHASSGFPDRFKVCFHILRAT